MSLSKPRFLPRASGSLNRDELAVFRAALEPIAADPGRSATMRYNASRMLAQLGRDTASHGRWKFMLVDPREYARVTRHLRLNSRRPALSAELLSICLREVGYDSNEILASRFALADELGVDARVVSTLMGELVKCGAVERCFLDDAGHRCRHVRYFVNEKLATHLKGAARDEAQAAAPVIRLVVSREPPTERRSRAKPASRPVL